MIILGNRPIKNYIAPCFSSETYLGVFSAASTCGVTHVRTYYAMSRTLAVRCERLLRSTHTGPGDSFITIVYQFVWVKFLRLLAMIILEIRLSDSEGTETLGIDSAKMDESTYDSSTPKPSIVERYCGGDGLRLLRCLSSLSFTLARRGLRLQAALTCRNSFAWLRFWPRVHNRSLIAIFPSSCSLLLKLLGQNQSRYPVVGFDVSRLWVPSHWLSSVLIGP